MHPGPSQSELQLDLVDEELETGTHEGATDMIAEGLALQENQ
jgi:hypothetical protein